MTRHCLAVPRRAGGGAGPVAPGPGPCLHRDPAAAPGLAAAGPLNFIWVMLYGPWVLYNCDRRPMVCFNDGCYIT